MDRSPVRNLVADFDFSIEPDTPDMVCPPTKRYRPAPHEYAYGSRCVCMAHYITKKGKIIAVEYRPLIDLSR